MSVVFKRAIVILADGARPDVLQDEMARGDLPHLARLSERGTNTKMTSCFPSTTGPAYLPYLTGCFPGTCNVPGIRWFDKSTYSKRGWGFKSFRSYCGPESLFFDSDMNPSIHTIWEAFEKPRGIFAGVTKGLARKHDLTRFSRLWHYYYAHLTDRWSFIDAAAWNTLKPLIAKRDFDFVFMVYPSVDEYSHLSSPFHLRVRQAYREIDAYVGKTVAALRDAGILDETLIVLVADHGLSETHTHFDVGPWLEKEKKLRTFYYSNIFKFRFDAVSMVSGNAMTHLYFRGEKGWDARMSFEELSTRGILLDELRHHPAVDLVITQGVGGEVHLQTARGHGWFSYDKDRDLFSYRFDREDPLAVFSRTDPRLATGFSREESLKLTWDSHYPDVFVQTHQIFDSPRAGDVMLSARSGFDLRERYERLEHKSSHGSICPEHIFVPLVANFKVNTPFVRSVDVMPTVMALMDKSLVSGSLLDGMSRI